jgi:hypothetical protein
MSCTWIHCPKRSKHRFEGSDDLLRLNSCSTTRGEVASQTQQRGRMASHTRMFTCVTLCYFDMPSTKDDAHGSPPMCSQPLETCSCGPTIAPWTLGLWVAALSWSPATTKGLLACVETLLALVGFRRLSALLSFNPTGIVECTQLIKGLSRAIS